jgi:hypothetical protein
MRPSLRGRWPHGSWAERGTFLLGCLPGVRSSIVGLEGSGFREMGSKWVRVRIGWDKESGPFLTQAGPPHMVGDLHATKLDK